MKTSTLLAGIGLALSLGLAGSASAGTPRLDQREHHQRQRIHNGVTSGELTRPVHPILTNTLVTNISVGNNPRRLAVDPTGTSVYVPQSSLSGTVTVISTATNVVTGTISTGAGSIAIAFPVPTQGPANKDHCKDGGWATFTNPEFKNQGQCIKFVNHMDEHDQ